MSQNIIDKLINHVVSEYFLINIYDRTLIDTNIATRKNKGTHYGIKLLKKYINEIKDEKFYILKFDISKYFYNLDHKILKDLIRKKIKDKDVLNIIDKIIDSTNCDYINKTINKEKQKEIDKVKNNNKELINSIKNIPLYKYGKGLPIGNMSSQVLAILYLNELDHFIKEDLKIKYYIRYMDDGILIHKDKEYLKYCLKEIEKILNKYKLELNNKTKIYNSFEGFEFLGFRYFIKNNKLIMKVTNRTKRKFKRKIKNMTKLMKEGKITKEIFIQVRNSYLGHLNYGKTKKLIKLNIKTEEKIIETKEVRIENKNVIIK